MLYKNIVPVTMLVGLLSACTQARLPNDGRLVGLANPASVYCHENGGQSILKTDTDGNQYSMCQLGNGKEVEEWAYYREHQRKCLATKAITLINQVDPGDDVIKQVTQATIIRRVTPNMGVTADYQPTRVTIIVDGVSHQITHAVCG